MQPRDDLPASSYKHCLVWFALATSVQECLREGNDNAEENFCVRWTRGSLHIVESSDVTNARLKVLPKVGCTPQHPGTNTEPEQEPNLQQAGVVAGRGEVPRQGMICLVLH